MHLNSFSNATSSIKWFAARSSCKKIDALFVPHLLWYQSLALAKKQKQLISCCTNTHPCVTNFGKKKKWHLCAPLAENMAHPT